MIDTSKVTRSTFIESILHVSVAIARRQANKEIDIEYRSDISGEEASRFCSNGPPCVLQMENLEYKNQLC